MSAIKVGQGFKSPLRQTLGEPCANLAQCSFLATQICWWKGVHTTFYSIVCMYTYIILYYIYTVYIYIEGLPPLPPTPENNPPWQHVETEVVVEVSPRHGCCCCSCCWCRCWCRYCCCCCCCCYCCCCSSLGHEWTPKKIRWIELTCFRSCCYWLTSLRNTRHHATEGLNDLQKHAAPGLDVLSGFYKQQCEFSCWACCSYCWIAVPLTVPDTPPKH